MQPPMTYAILLLIGIVVSYKLYKYTQQFFDDGINYNLDSPHFSLCKHIQNTVIHANKDADKSFYQIHNASIPTNNGIIKTDSVLVANSGIYVLKPHSYPFTVINTEFGFHKKINDSKSKRMYVSSVEDQNLKRDIHALFPDMDNLSVYYYHVFSSQIEFATEQPGHIIKLEEINSILENNENVLNTMDVALISGMFRFHSSIKPETKKSKTSSFTF